MQSIILNLEIDNYTILFKEKNENLAKKINYKDSFRQMKQGALPDQQYEVSIKESHTKCST